MHGIKLWIVIDAAELIGLPHPAGDSLDGQLLQHYRCKMLPELVSVVGTPWRVLPPGLHDGSLEDVAAAFATNPWRRQLFGGLVEGASRLRAACCQTIYVDGSYVTGKPRPADFDVCWDPLGVSRQLLDDVFLDFTDGRRAQKAQFGGEFFPSSMVCSDVSDSFLNFMQLDRFTGERKGIVRVSLVPDRILISKAQP